MSAYSDRIIADGASHYWRLGETSGGVALDIIGGATGTISGGVTLAQPGALSDGDSAMVFDGATGKIVTAAAIDVPIAATIEGWVKTTSHSQQPAFSNRLIGQAGSVVYVGTTTGKAFFFSTSPGGGAGSGVRMIADGQWHYIAAVITGQNDPAVVLYVDGVFDQSAPFNVRALGTGPGAVGWDGDTGQLFSGSLDDLAIYPRALTPEEIAAHYTLGITPETQPPTGNQNHDGSNLDAAVVELLKTDPELAVLLPDGVYVDDAPPGAQRFAIVSLTGPTVDNHTMDGGGFEVVSYLVTANGVSSAIGGPQIKAAADRIDAILHDAAPVVDGFPAVSIARTGRVRPPLELDPDDRSIRWYRRGGTYELFASK